MKCPTCQTPTQKTWQYCPKCGTQLKSKSEIYSPDRLRYMLGQDEGGRFIYENFPAVKHAGIRQWKKVKDVRPTLGDYSHLLLFNIHLFSFIHIQPQVIQDIYVIGRFLGRSSVGQAMKTIGAEKLVNLLTSSGLFWHIFQNKKLQWAWTSGWKNLKAANIESITPNKNKKTVTWIMKDTANSIVKSKHPTCFFLYGVIAGQAEATFSGYWTAEETKCQSKEDSHCEIKTSLHNQDTPAALPTYTKKETESIINDLIQKTQQRKTNLRQDLGEYNHISFNQSLNYMLLSISKGHEILSKEAGKTIGQKLTENQENQDTDETLKNLKETFDFWKTGILTWKNKDDNTVIQIKENTYSSGVNNISMKLDTFLAGIIEGALNQSTGEKWQVNETKCLANGDDYCEFTCRRQDR